MRNAAVMLIIKDRKILGVSRKDNPTAFGLIGGKVDEGETPEEALIRETKEETGLNITKYEKVFERTDGNFKCFTYLCEVEGDVQTTEKGVVKEVGWPELLAGPFGEYNRQLLDHMRNQLTENWKNKNNG